VTVSRPAQLGAGDEVRIGGVTHTIAGLTGGLVHLVDAAGIKSVASLAELFSSPRNRCAAGAAEGSVASSGLAPECPGQPCGTSSLVGAAHHRGAHRDAAGSRPGRRGQSGL
jgi:hypothetical protein